MAPTWLASLLAGSALAFATPAQAQRVEHIVAFGDSYADDGNAFQLAGIDPLTTVVYTTGRFSAAGNPLPNGNAVNGLAIYRSPSRRLDGNAFACVTCHTLPTGGTARFFSPLGVDDFVKKSSLVSFTRKGLERLGRDIVHIAELEGLEAHARSVAIRLKD